MRLRRPGWALLERLAAGLVLLAAPSRVLCQAPQEKVAYSTDTTVRLSGAVLADEAVARDDLLGGVTVASLGLDATIDLRGLELLRDGAALFALDIAAKLPGGARAEARDVVRTAGASFTLAFDGSAAVIPDGVRVDAVAAANRLLLLSFDQTVLLGTVIADDEDLVAWDGAAYSLVFDGSARGFAPALDLDGAAIDPGGGWVLSFDQSGRIGDLVFDDEDLLLVPAGGGAVTLFVDGSALHAGSPLAAADLDAVALPVPGTIFADDFEAGATAAWSATVGGS